MKSIFWNRNILLTLCVALVSVSCDPPENDLAWLEMEQEKTTLSQRLELLKYRHQKGENSTSRALASSEADLEMLTQKAAGLIPQRAALMDEIEELENQLAKAGVEEILYKRSSAKGRKYDHFTMPDGRVFEDVIISGVNDLGVAIRHSQGTATLRFADLTQKQRETFGLIEESSLAAECQEREAALAYEQWIDQGMKELEEQKKFNNELAARNDAKNAKLRLAARRKYDAQARLGPLAQASRPFGRSSSWSSRWYDGYRRPSVYYYTPYVSAPRTACVVLMPPGICKKPTPACDETQKHNSNHTTMPQP